MLPTRIIRRHSRVAVLASQLLLRRDPASPDRGGERFTVTQCLFGINVGELGDRLAENGPVPR